VYLCTLQDMVLGQPRGTYVIYKENSRWGRTLGSLQQQSSMCKHSHGVELSSTTLAWPVESCTCENVSFCLLVSTELVAHLWAKTLLISGSISLDACLCKSFWNCFISGVSKRPHYLHTVVLHLLGTLSLQDLFWPTKMAASLPSGRLWGKECERVSNHQLWRLQFWLAISPGETWV